MPQPRKRPARPKPSIAVPTIPDVTSDGSEVQALAELLLPHQARVKQLQRMQRLDGYPDDAPIPGAVGPGGTALTFDAAYEAAHAAQMKILDDFPPRVVTLLRESVAAQE